MRTKPKFKVGDIIREKDRKRSAGVVYRIVATSLPHTRDVYVITDIEDLSPSPVSTSGTYYWNARAEWSQMKQEVDDKYELAKSGLDLILEDLE